MPVLRRLSAELPLCKHEDVARYLASELREAIDARYFGETFDLLTVVPMSRDRYASRGFNQARTLAEFLMKDPPEPLQDTFVDYGLLKKKNSGGSMQHLLGAEGRRQNIRSAVSVGPNRPLEGKSVLLLDDIVTTGATVGECCSSTTSSRPVPRWGNAPPSCDCPARRESVWRPSRSPVFRKKLRETLYKKSEKV